MLVGRVGDVDVRLARGVAVLVITVSSMLVLLGPALPVMKLRLG